MRRFPNEQNGSLPFWHPRGDPHHAETHFSPAQYRHHKASGQAIVHIEGRDYYLDPWKSAASKAEYNRLLQEYLTHGRVIEDAPDEITVNEVLLSYIRWATGYYTESNELDYIKLALRPVKDLYGRTPAAKFGPLALKAVRERVGFMNSVQTFSRRIKERLAPVGNSCYAPRSRKPAISRSTPDLPPFCGHCGARTDWWQDGLCPPCRRTFNIPLPPGWRLAMLGTAEDRS